MIKQILLLFSLNILMCSSQVEPNWFLEQIYSNYSNNSIKNFEIIWNKLNIVNINNSDNYSCYSSNDLIKIFNITDEINKQEFTQMSTALIWHILSPQCKYEINEKCEVANTGSYTYGIITIVVTWALSIFNVFILSRFEKRQTQKTGTSSLVLALNGLAVGTLLGDALLHIIPSTLGMTHDHINNEKSVQHRMNRFMKFTNKSIDDVNDSKDPLWKMSATLATIFALYLFEALLGHDHDHGHGHSHGQIHPEIELGNEKVIPEKNKNQKFKKYLKGIQPNGWVAFIGDVVHKLADGFAIGAAFSESFSLGFSTSIAILFHEIPHELGDYAVLKAAGFSNWIIFILNTTSSLFCLIGFLIITSVTPDESVREWMFALTAGVFFYLALVVMMPRLNSVFKKDKNGKRNITTLFAVVILFIVGWVMMLLIAYYEEEMQLILPSDSDC